MDNKILIASLFAVVVAFVGCRAYRRNNSVIGQVLSKQESNFALEACNEGLRCIGYSCIPGVSNDAEAVPAAIAFCMQQGNAVTASSLAAAGMVAHYVSHHNLSESNAAALLLRANELLGAQFSWTGEQVHDARMNLIKTIPRAQFIVNTVAQHGFQSSRLVKDGELREAFREIVSGS